MKTGKLILLCYSILFLIACKNKDSVPSSVLPKDKMQAALWDMMRADQFLNNYIFSRDTAADKRKEEEKIYARVLSVHNISWEDFRKSFRWYADHPDILKPIMDSLGVLPPAIQPVQAPAETSPPPTGHIPVDTPGTAATIQREKTNFPADTVRKNRKIIKAFKGD